MPQANYLVICEQTLQVLKFNRSTKLFELTFPEKKNLTFELIYEQIICFAQISDTVLWMGTLKGIIIEVDVLEAKICKL